MLEQHHEIEQYIRDTAYQLWNSAGCPDGLSDKFWDLARDISTDIEGIISAGVHYVSDTATGLLAETGR